MTTYEKLAKHYDAAHRGRQEYDQECAEVLHAIEGIWDVIRAPTASHVKVTSIKYPNGHHGGQVTLRLSETNSVEAGFHMLAVNGVFTLRIDGVDNSKNLRDREELAKLFERAFVKAIDTALAPPST